MNLPQEITNAKLLLRPRPFAGESQPGYQLRVAEINGYSSGLWLSNHFLGMTRVTIRQSEHAARAASLLGLEPSELDRLAYAYEGGYLSYFGQKLHLRHVKIKCLAVCPHCLKARAATNAFWELKYAVACPFHGIRLIDTCERCGKKISWRRNKVCECPKCRFDYRDSATEKAHPEVLELISLFYSKANISLPEVPSSNSAFGMPLAALASESLITLIWMFSFISRSFQMESESALGMLPSCSPGRLSREYYDVRKVAYFLSEWPDRLIDGLYMKISSQERKTRYLASGFLLMNLTRQKMPRILQQVGQTFIESARLLHGKNFRVDSQTLEHAKAKVSTCF